MDILPLILAACLLTGAPRGACRAEIAGGASLTDFPVPVVVPSWATANWIEAAAAIVQGEAARTDGARLMTACTILNDVERGWDPWRLVYNTGRWHGRARPTDEAREAVREALGGGCAGLPVCLYLGNWTDYRGWVQAGSVGDNPVWAWSNGYGETVCIMEQR